MPTRKPSRSGFDYANSYMGPYYPHSYPHGMRYPAHAYPTGYVNNG